MFLPADAQMVVVPLRAVGPTAEVRVELRLDVVRQRDPRAVGVRRLEAGQGDRGHVVAVVAEACGDLVPRPCPEPEPGDEDDRGAPRAGVGVGHAVILLRSTHDGPGR